MYINDDFVINFFFTNKGRYKIIWNDIEERLPKLKYYHENEGRRKEVRSSY